jgi:hypothetical protein
MHEEKRKNDQMSYDVVIEERPIVEATVQERSSKWWWSGESLAINDNDVSECGMPTGVWGVFVHGVGGDNPQVQGIIVTPLSVEV